MKFYIENIQTHDDEKKGIQTAAMETAKQFTWDIVVRSLIKKLEYQARVQGIV